MRDETKNGLPGLTGVAVDAGVVPKANVGAGVDVDVPKPLPNDISILAYTAIWSNTDTRRVRLRMYGDKGKLQHGRSHVR